MSVWPGVILCRVILCPGVVPSSGPCENPTFVLFVPARALASLFAAAGGL